MRSRITVRRTVRVFAWPSVAGWGRVRREGDMLAMRVVVLAVGTDVGVGREGDGRRRVGVGVGSVRRAGRVVAVGRGAVAVVVAARLARTSLALRRARARRTGFLIIAFEFVQLVEVGLGVQAKASLM